MKMIQQVLVPIIVRNKWSEKQKKQEKNKKNK
jgi:hypothetical protein